MTIEKAQNSAVPTGAASALSAGFETAADDLSMFASQIREAMSGTGDLPHPWKLDDWLTDYRDRFDRRRKVSNVELTGSRAGLSPVSPATEGSEVERRVGGQADASAP